MNTKGNSKEEAIEEVSTGAISYFSTDKSFLYFEKLLKKNKNSIYIINNYNFKYCHQTKALVIVRIPKGSMQMILVTVKVSFDPT